MANKILLLFSLWWSTALSAQHPILCGNEIFSNMVRDQYPELENQFHSTFESAKKSAPIRSSEPLEVNVVVHVVWKEEAENLHDSIIIDQIRILNEDFNRLNADTNNLRSFFKPEAGSAQIRFILSEIVRVHTDINFQINLLGTNLLAEVKHTADGGSDAHDPQQYINIWVCKIQPITIFGIVIGQVLGFAFPPNNLPHWPQQSGAPAPEEDGVVIDYRVFGSNNPNLIVVPGGGGNLTVKGRTPVHEMGHYLGLRHIWGDGGLLGPNDCAQSDGIEDTPHANSQSAFDCDTSKNTCTQVEPYYLQDVPDLIENFMDYASEDCMNMFTHGQVELMRNILTGPRNGLLMPFSAVSDLAYESDFKLFPNPTSGSFDIEFSTSSSTQAFIRIFNLQGHIVFSAPENRFDPGPHRMTVERHGWAPGMYFAEIRTQKQIITKILIIQ